jgi:hypothetical protein
MKVKVNAAKRFFVAGLLLVASSAVMAAECGVNGVTGVISADGQSIETQTAIPLKDQARTYGGYQKAAEFLEKNRMDIAADPHYSSAVKKQVSDDLTKNESDLKCWAALCQQDSANEACRF